MIRAATEVDIPALVTMGAAFHAASSLPFDYDADATAAFLTGIVPAGGCFISPHGMIGGVLAPAYTQPQWLMAVELFWWAERDGLALLRAFEGWARENGANEVRMTSLHSLARADGLLRAKGFDPVEVSYRKAL